MVGPAPPAPLDLNRFTVSAYFRAKGRELDLNTAKRVGGFATAAYRRAHRGDAPPKVREFHAGLGGYIDVSAYPPPLGPEILERALAEVVEQDSYKAPPPPSG
jgi:hypothetical protein